MNLGGRLFARFYISIIRGTPLILQLSIIYFVLPEIIGKKIPIFLAGLIGFSINSAAYIFEHIRAGINSIDEGQIIAARSMGINDKIITRKIIMPQALKNITPSIINEIINLIKETSIISIFGVADIMRRANIIAAEQYNYLSPLIMAGICYYSLISIMSYLLNFIERRLGKKHA
jgi:polar amino acid transport system permease protein